MHLLMFVGSSERACQLTIEEYESRYRESASDIDLIERIYLGGICCNQLRAALWPYIFGLTKKRDRFVPRNKTTPASTTSPPSSASSESSPSSPSSSTSSYEQNNHQFDPALNNHNNTLDNIPKDHHSHNGLLSHSLDHNNHHLTHNHNHNHFQRRTSSSASSTVSLSSPRFAPSTEDYIHIEHEDNAKRWRELERQYLNYQSQWESIDPEQELRFSIFRERKALIERDVVRCDRLHPFYANNSNLSTFTALLMTYMMYDFDIGYSQGMSDIAAPILYVFDGDLVKSFWVFVEVMKLFRKNFEPSQKTIHSQLNCLYRLIKLTDPKFALYLKQNECSNCFFAFRCIVCQFKRELMKNEYENDYSKVLSLWDTIWTVQQRHDLLLKRNHVHSTFNNHSNTITNGHTNGTTIRVLNGTNHRDPEAGSGSSKNETEKFILALCLSMIRRERNLIMADQMDASEIHQHFINPPIATELDHFVEVAYQIYNHLNTDCDLRALVKGIGQSDHPLSSTAITTTTSTRRTTTNTIDILSESPVEKVEDLADTSELLKDYFIISPTAYNTTSTRCRCSVSQKSWDQHLLHHRNNNNNNNRNRIN